MGLYFKEEYEKEKDEDFDALNFRSKRRNLRPLPQTKVPTNKVIDASRKALMAGKRVSKNGKIYWETRSNRSDNKGSMI